MFHNPRTGVIMKGPFLLIILLIIPLSIFSQNDSTAWIDSGAYLENIRKIAPIDFIRYSKDDNIIYTFSRDRIFRKWDAKTGFVLDSVIISSDSIIENFDISSDDSRYAYYCDYKREVKLFNMDDNSEIKLCQPSKYSFPCSGDPSDYSYSLLFHPTRKQLIFPRTTQLQCD